LGSFHHFAHITEITQAFKHSRPPITSLRSYDGIAKMTRSMAMQDSEAYWKRLLEPPCMGLQPLLAGFW